MGDIQKISASLLNSWIYYKNNPSDRAYQSFVNSLKGEFKGNKWTRRGHKFEDEVFKGEHGKLSKLVENLPKQEWCKKYIIVDGIKIKVSGKCDVIDKDKGIIYDIKRKNDYYAGVMDDSMQHPLYFYLNEWVTDFYYLIVAGKTNKDTVLHIAHYKRPEEKELKKYILETIKEFFAFLKDKDLFEIYLEKQKTETKLKKKEQ